MVHITDVKKTTLTDKVTDDYIKVCNEKRFAKKYVPRGYIPDFNWTTIHDDKNQPIKPVKQEEDLTETTVTPAAPTEVEGPPGCHLRFETKQQSTPIPTDIEGPPDSHLRFKTKQQSTPIKQEQAEHNPASLDPPECNAVKVEVNNVQVDTENKSTLMQLALTSWSCQGNFRPALICHFEEN